MIIHGGPGASHDYFLPHLLPLMRTSRLIFIDEHGSGKSSKFEDPGQYTIANMVEDIEAVRQALGLGKIVFSGIRSVAHWCRRMRSSIRESLSSNSRQYIRQH
jgi:proline iminopeptidase